MEVTNSLADISQNEIERWRPGVLYSPHLPLGNTTNNGMKEGWINMDVCWLLFAEACDKGWLLYY